MSFEENNMLNNDTIRKSLKNLIWEEHKTLYGHKKSILSGNIDFKNKGNNKIFDQYDLIDQTNVSFIEDPQKYFNLWRCGWSSKKILHQPNNTKGPTLCLTLFAPFNKIESFDQAYKWMRTYVIPQLIFIMVYNYYFQFRGNIRLYLDYFTIKNIFEELSPDHGLFDLTNYQIQYFDNEQEHIKKTKSKIDLGLSFCGDIFKNNKNTKNGFEMIMAYYKICSTLRYNPRTNLANYNGSPIDIFVYKFNTPFIETNENITSHITNGYLGTIVRYISTIQEDYTWNNNTLIKRPRHLVWRDSHSTMIGYNDYLWIKELNDVTLNDNIEIYFVPTSMLYSLDHHNYVKNDIDNKYHNRNPSAGIMQIINSSESDTLIPFDMYKKSIGIAFLINNQGEIPIFKYRPQSVKNNKLIQEYDYGIDEYILSSFYCLDYFKRKSIYYVHYPLHCFLSSKTFDLFMKSELLLIFYFISKGELALDSVINKFKFVEMIEDLRENYMIGMSTEEQPSADKNKDEYYALRLLLAIYPTKYQFNEMNYSYTTDKSKENNDSINLNNIHIQKIIEEYKKKLMIEDYQIEYYENLTTENLEKLYITSTQGCLNTSLEWNVEMFGNQPKYNYDEICSSDNYYSGFYFDKDELYNRGLLREPSDLKKMVKYIQNNPNRRDLLPALSQDYGISKQTCQMLLKKDSSITPTQQISNSDVEIFRFEYKNNIYECTYNQLFYYQNQFIIFDELKDIYSEIKNVELINDKIDLCIFINDTEHLSPLNRIDIDDELQIIGGQFPSRCKKYEFITKLNIMKKLDCTPEYKNIIRK